MVLGYDVVEHGPSHSPIYTFSGGRPCTRDEAIAGALDQATNHIRLHTGYKVEAVALVPVADLDRLTAELDEVKRERDEARAQERRVRMLADHADEYGYASEHVEGCEGEPDCAACWIEDIRAALDGTTP